MRDNASLGDNANFYQIGLHALFGVRRKHILLYAIYFSHLHEIPIGLMLLNCPSVLAEYPIDRFDWYLKFQVRQWHFSP